MKIVFSKMEGLGNDFIIMDDREGHTLKKAFYPALAEKLCDRHFGIGGDGLIIVKNSSEADIRFLIFNSDGSEAEMCGNGMRCFAKYLYDKGIIHRKKFCVETLAGIIVPEIFTDEKNKTKSVKVDMGEPATDKISETISVKSEKITITQVSMGNPHAVVFTDKTDNRMVKEIGPLVENHKKFPNKTNVEFVEVAGRSELIVKVWERGAGETLACGTGACAALVASCLNKKTERKAIVRLPGGELFIEWDATNNHVYKTGSVSLVFEGYCEL